MHRSRGSKRRYSLFGSATHRGKIGDYIIWVNIEDGGWEKGYAIRGDKPLPNEIREAVEAWIKNNGYAGMELTEYLRKMFNRLEYL